MVRRRKPPDGRANNGGVRNATPGKSYANRTDMAAQPVRTPPSAEYGESKRLADAQRAVPLAQMPAPPTAQAPAASLPGGFAGPYPGELGDFTRPSERPGEPLTTGIGAGPGAGPEALAMTNRPDPELEALRPYLPTLELLASQPNASPSARMFVKRLRGSMGPPQG